MSYCTYRNYPPASIEQMHRRAIATAVTKLGNIPNGSLFITLSDTELSEYPPVVCIKTEDDGQGVVSYMFGLTSEHSIHGSGDTLVIPLCGDYLG